MRLHSELPDSMVRVPLALSEWVVLGGSTYLRARPRYVAAVWAGLGRQSELPDSTSVVPPALSEWVVLGGSTYLRA